MLHAAGSRDQLAGKAGALLGIATTSAKQQWPAAEAAELVRIAAEEHILSRPGQPISSTNFSVRAWEARTAQQMRDERN